MTLLGSSRLNDRQLRYFGVSLVGLGLAAGAFAQWKWQSPGVATAFYLAAGVGGVIYFLFPTIRPRVYQAFQTLTYPIQWLMTILMLGTLFFLVFVPIGILFRFSGKSLHRDSGFDGWSPRTDPAEPRRYFDTY